MNRSGLVLLARALTLPAGPTGAVELPDDPLDLLSADERFSLRLCEALARVPHRGTRGTRGTKGVNHLRVVGTPGGVPSDGSDGQGASRVLK
jgi:hypothetical protein